MRVIFDDWCLSGLGLGAICEKLNADLDRYPPPTRNKKDENDLRQTWSRSQLQAMLRNPKYTGYNVWGRHDKRRGRPFIRPREQWIWSTTPSHEPIVSRELFDAGRGARAAQRRRRQRTASEALPRSAREAGQDASTCCAVGCGAASAGGGWKAATRRAPTGTAAST